MPPPGQALKVKSEMERNGFKKSFGGGSYELLQTEELDEDVWESHDPTRFEPAVTQSSWADDNDSNNDVTSPSSSSLPNPNEKNEVLSPQSHTVTTPKQYGYSGHKITQEKTSFAEGKGRGSSKHLIASPHSLSVQARGRGKQMNGAGGAVLPTAFTNTGTGRVGALPFSNAAITAVASDT